MKLTYLVVLVAVVAVVAFTAIGGLGSSTNTSSIRDSRSLAQSVDDTTASIEQSELAESSAFEGALYAQIITTGDANSIYTNFNYEY